MFELVFEKGVIDDIGTVDCYGVKSPNGQIIRNLCVDQGEAERFVQRLNQEKGSEIHLLDFVDDFLLQRFF